MKTIKKIGLVSAVAFALFTFNACGDDSNSTSAPGENSALSSAEEDDESSSSVIPDPDRESSSSSRMSSSATTENLDKSSSSVVIPCSSSSVILSGGSAGVEGSSSSSAKSSSSVNSSSSNKQSSSSVKSSSSSVKSSSSVASSSSAKSSSSFVKMDYTNPSLSYGELEDPRDHRKYKYLTIKGKNKDGERDSVTVMAENLNVGIMVLGVYDQADDLKIEKYCYNNDSLNCIQYGGLYQWAEAMQLPSECNTKSCADQIKPNHQGICPDRWRLLTYDDFYIVVHADENDNPLVEGVRAIAFGGHNYSGYSLIGAGYNWSYKFKNLNEGTYWFYPEESVKNAEVATYSSNQNKYSSGMSRSEVYKTHGFSVRCVKVE